ncbi:MAG TPA: alpha/beta hydrolase [Acidimicrobiales bacterium]|nr:alpha/beta hydrolase [Acidimicrobiales bacterium]
MNSPPLTLPGFEYRRVNVEDVIISCAIRGSGSPVLMLHGYPQSHLTWRHVAPALAEDHTVVLADLRGYGDSDKPAPDAAGFVYSKRAMAHDQVGLMLRLGFKSFQLVGHDRGARAGHRLVLDHPGTVTRFAVLDIVPTHYSLRHLTLTTVLSNYQWFFLPAGRGIPEHLIAADPGFWVREQTAHLMGKGASIEPEVMDDYIRCFRDPRAIAACCADFRSSPGIDLDHDDETAAARQKIECPVLVLWGTQSTVADPLSVWQLYAPDVQTEALPTGHFLPEEAPELVSASLRKFLD